MNLKTEDTEVKRGRDGLTREQAQHVTVVNMGLDLSPLNTAGVTAFDEQTQQKRAVERGRVYLIKRNTGSQGFFACDSRAGQAPDYMVGFISRDSQYNRFDEYNRFMRGVVVDRLGTDDLASVQYSRALPERGERETPYTLSTAAFAKSMADAAATRRPDGTYPDFSMPEEQAFNNVYLFYRISGKNDAFGRGRYIAFGRFIVTGYRNNRLDLKPIEPRTPPQRFGFAPTPPQARLGPLTPEQLADGLQILAEAAERQEGM